jgi:hypothetical protein
MATTLRLPDDLEELLDDHCQQVGGVKSRVMQLALRVLRHPRHARQGWSRTAASDDRKAEAMRPEGQ